MNVASLCCAAVVALASSSALADTPRQFLEKAVEGDNAEVTLGRLAQQQAVTPQVRNYGRTLETDHATARAQAESVARHMNIDLRGDHAPVARSDRERLSSLHGRDFDRAFIQLMIVDHRQDIGAYRAEAMARQGDVSEFARAQLQTLQRHLDIALQLQSQVADHFAGPGYGGPNPPPNRGWR